MSLKMWLPLNEFDGNDMIINNGIDNYEYNYDNSSEITLPSSVKWKSICYGNGKFVAIAGSNSDKAAYSTDGINWVAATLPSTADWYSVCYGNGKFVAIAGSNSDKAAYSTDGINWTATTLPYINTGFSVCYGNGKFVTVAWNSSIAAYSTDGINWTETTLPSTGYWYDICYGNGKFVAVAGNSDSTTSSSNKAAYSTDGINWTAATLPSSAYWESVCYGNDKFVAVANSDKAAYSTDGINWTETILLSSAYWKSVCYGNGKFVAITYINGISAYSTDGINWKGTEEHTGYLYDICYGNGKFVAIAGGKYESNKVTYSTDGITWLNTTNPFAYSANIIDNTVANKTISVKSNTNSIVNALSNKATLSFRYYYSTSSKGNISGSESTILFSTSEDKTLYVKLNTSDSLYFALPTKLTENDWNTVTVIIDNVGEDKSINVYLNGKLEVTKQLVGFNPVIDNTKVFNIIYDLSPSYLIDYRIYDEILLPSEIKDLALFEITHCPLDEIYNTTTTDLYYGCYKSGNLNVIGDNIEKTKYDNYTNYKINNSSSDTLLSTDLLSDYNYTDKVLLSKIMIRVNKYNDGSLSLRAGRFSNDNLKEYASKLLVNGDNIDIGVWKEFDLYNTGIKNYIRYKNSNNELKTGMKINDTDYIEYNPVIEVINSGISNININKYELPDKYDIECGIYDEKEDTIMLPITNTDNILISNDKGNKWNISKLPVNGNWNSMVKTKDEVISIGNGIVSNVPSLYSTDRGYNWNKCYAKTPQDILLPSSANWYSTCYGNDKFVAVSNSNKAVYSMDGITWTETTLPSSTDWCSVCYGNGKFVAISGSSMNYSNKVAYSTDGITWTETTLPSSAYWISVCYGNDKFVAVAADFIDKSAYSTDGITWTETTLPSDDYWRSICYGNDKFVAVASSSNIVAYSTDGINWKSATLPSSTKWRSVCYGNGKFITVDYNSNKSAYSTDGINWTETTLPFSNNWFSVCYGNGKFVAIAYYNSNNKVAYSTDGINWTQTTFPSSAYWQSVCYGNDKFVAITYNNNKAAYSTDGINWTNKSYSPSNISLLGIVTLDNKTIYISNTGYYYLTITNGNITVSNFISHTFENSIIYNNLIIPKTGKTLYEITSVSDSNISLTSHTLPSTYSGNVMISNIVHTNDAYFITVDCTDHIICGSTLDKLTKVTLPTDIQNKVWKGIECINDNIFMISEDNKLVVIDYTNNGDTLEVNINNSYDKNINEAVNRFCLKVDNSLLVFPLEELYYSKLKMYSKIDMDIDIKNIQYIEDIVDDNDNTLSLPYVNDYYYEWKESTSPSSAAWVSVCYGNGKFVAVPSNNNKAAYSTDGINWKSATLPSVAYWESVCYGNGKFVTVAYNSNKIAYSTDGITWTAATLPSSTNWESVCYGNGKFVTVAYNSNNTAYSTDGITWTAATLPSTANWYSVCYGNGKFVAVASNNSNKAAYSTDGINWTATTLPYINTGFSVCYGNGKFVTVAKSSNKAAYSTDGITWTETTLPSDSSWFSVCYGNGKFVTIARNSNKAAYSIDGINWTAATLPSNSNWHSVCYGNGKFVTIADNSYKVAYLQDKCVINPELTNTIDSYYGNSTYKPITKDVNSTCLQKDSNSYYYNDSSSYKLSNISSNSSDTFTNIFRYKDYLYAIKTNGDKTLYKGSFSGGNFNMITGTRTETGIIEGEEVILDFYIQFESMKYANGKFVVLCIDNSDSNSDYITKTAAYSTDGINWTQTTLPCSIYYNSNSFKYVNDRFIIINRYTSDGNALYSNYIIYSTDGINWKKTTLPSSQQWYNICYGNGKYVIISSEYKAAYSTDGINWKETTLPSYGDSNCWWDKIIYGNGKYVILNCNNNGTSGHSSNIAAYSTDGINWTATTLPSFGNGSAWNISFYFKNKFIAISENDKGIYSKDGINWSSMNLPSFEIEWTIWRNYSYNNDIIVLFPYQPTSDYNKAIYSTDGINWTATALPPIISDNTYCYWRSVCYYNDKFVVFSTDNQVAYSTDGINWTTTTTLPSSTYWQTACYGNGKYVSIGYNKVVYSTDGINWSNKKTTETTKEVLDYSIELGSNDTSVATTEDRYKNLLLVSKSKALLCKDSQDISKETTPVNISSDKLGDYISACYEDISVFVSKVTTSSSYSGIRIKTTSTGIDNIISIVLPVNPPYKDIIIRNGQFIVVPSSGDKLCVSSDGSAWDTISIPFSESWSCGYYDINGIFYLAPVSSTNIYYSNDLVNWNNYILPSAVTISNIINNNGRTLFITNNSRTTYYIDNKSIDNIENKNDIVDISDYDIKVVGNNIDNLGGLSPIGKRSTKLNSNSYIETISAKNNKFSISVWIKCNNWSNGTIINMKELNIPVISVNNNLINSTKSVSELANNWHLYTVIVDMTDIKNIKYTLYIDKEKINENTVSNSKTLDNNNLTIKINSITLEVSDFKIYNKSLSEEEITYVYNDTLEDCSVAIYSNNTLFARNIKENSNPVSDNILPIDSNFVISDKDSINILNESVHYRTIEYNIKSNYKGKFALDLSNIKDKLISNHRYVFSLKVSKSENFKGTLNINISNNNEQIVLDNIATRTVDDMTYINIPFIVANNIANYAINITVNNAGTIIISELRLYSVQDDCISISKSDGLCVNQIYETTDNTLSFGYDAVKCNKLITK